MTRFPTSAPLVAAVLAPSLAAPSVLAGEPLPTVAPDPVLAFDACEWLSDKPGYVKFPDNPWIQEFGVFGRFQWQAAYLDAEDADGNRFSDAYTEVRRFRLGAELKFLRVLGIKANVNLVDDASNEVTQWPGEQRLGWGYEDFDEALISLDLAEAFSLDGFDTFSLRYGRHKFELSQEARTSSKKLLTVERSAISNKVYGSYRPTGVSLEAARGEWDAVVAFYSTDARTAVGINREFLGGWGNGEAYYGSLGYSPGDCWHFHWDYVYNDADIRDGEDSLFSYRWATSLSAEYDAGAWGVIVDGIWGDNGSAGLGVALPDRRGDFWGLVVMPYHWLVEDRLQGVVRYQYAGAEEDAGIRVNSRYLRKDHEGGSVASTINGRGNEHHSLYAGLNWLPCGHNLKIQAGAEYEWLNMPGVGSEGDLSAMTWWFAFRSFF